MMTFAQKLLGESGMATLSIATLVAFLTVSTVAPAQAHAQQAPIRTVEVHPMPTGERLLRGIGGLIGAATGAVLTVGGVGTVIGAAGLSTALVLYGAAVAPAVFVGALAVAAAGVGLVVYGGYQTYRAIRGEKLVDPREGINVPRDAESRPLTAPGHTPSGIGSTGAQGAGMRR